MAPAPVQAERIPIEETHEIAHTAPEPEPIESAPGFSMAESPRVTAPAAPAFSPASADSTQAADLQARSGVWTPQPTMPAPQLYQSPSLASAQSPPSQATDAPEEEPASPAPASDEYPAASAIDPATDASPEHFPTAESANSPETDQVFEDVFGRPRNLTPQPVVVPLFIDQQQRGQVFLQLPGGNQADILIDGSDLLEATANLVRPDIQAQLSAAVDETGQINLRDIRQMGLEVNVDERRLELQMQVPAALRATHVLDVNSRDLPMGYDTALRPSRTSAYVNVRGGQAVVWSGDASETGRQPVLLNFDGALNIGGWVLEGQVDFTEGNSSAWQLGNFSLVHDDISQAVRYRIGDLSVPTRGYQSSIPMGGITVARNFSLQPFRVTRPISRFEFFLEREATVEVFVNGRLVQTLQLEAGPQDVRNLPLNAGINGVQLVITDSVGQVQRLDFATGVSSDLLASGVQQFAYSLGLPSEQSGFERQYDASKTVLTLSHRIGITDQLTLGGYFQGNLERQLLGVEGTWATSFGNWTWDAAFSRDSSFGNDFAMRVFYDLLQGGVSGDNQKSLRIGLEYRGEDFVSLGEEDPSNPNSLDLTASYSQLIFGNMRATLSSRYQMTRNNTANAYDLGLSITQPLRQGFNLSLNGSYGVDTDGEPIQRISVGLTSSLPGQRQRITSTTTLDPSGRTTSRMNWNYSSPRALNSISNTLSLSLNANDIGVTNQTRYQGYRALLNLDHRITPGHSRETSSRLTWGTALVFADGIFGWSRPIDNSFAIVTRQGTAEGRLVRVNPSQTGDQGRANGSGPAVLPIQPYTLTTLSLDAPDLPVGYDLGASSYTLLPSYRSGTVIAAGTEATVFIRGVLVGVEGHPVSLQRGVVESLSDPDWPDVELFTNRVGRFALFGFKPGSYSVRMIGLENGITEFVIPEQASGLYEVGTLRLPVAVKAAPSRFLLD
ncbi:fimbria/pilus outer membrane usher protein [Romeria aff. gracilis LEGE 07310]|uniref:Fimbria/pilus outer membrane usher protein n=1 Tax=Vasconcelosia minhoensis LEGE 07310 TaxID=915328 RepID=A0A8J7A8N6_9CYAN|nr:fimbria/pilus outer membrane usher protein [Romeria gracilis]MBE9076001.1 fimbria/pilus outer membrane usher protein [Romeria aff. gracilis LEGE 07310]